MINRKVAAWVIIFAAFVFGLLVARAFGEPVPNRPNSLGVTDVYVNPNTYTLALPLAASVMDGATSVRFQPFATAALYDETVLFCGDDVPEQFAGTRGPVVIIYETRAHKMFHGVACHTLKAVFEVKGREQ